MEQLIPSILAAAILGGIGAYLTARLLHWKEQAQFLEDLIAYSTPICFVCRGDKLGHKTLEEFSEIDPVHQYMPSQLVFIPESNLR